MIEITRSHQLCYFNHIHYWCELLSGQLCSHIMLIKTKVLNKPCHRKVDGHWEVLKSIHQNLHLSPLGPFFTLLCHWNIWSLWNTFLFFARLIPLGTTTTRMSSLIWVTEIRLSILSLHEVRAWSKHFWENRQPGFRSWVGHLLVVWAYPYALSTFISSYEK